MFQENGCFRQTSRSLRDRQAKAWLEIYRQQLLRRDIWWNLPLDAKRQAKSCVVTKIKESRQCDFSPIIYMIELRDAKSLNLPTCGSEPNTNLPELLCKVLYNKCRPFRVLQNKMSLIGQILKQHTQKLKKKLIARKTPGASKILLAIFASKVDRTLKKLNQDNKGDTEKTFFQV